MKSIQKIVLLFALITMLASCQTETDANKILSNQDTKMAIMDTIANSSKLSLEMMDVMMKNENGRMRMIGNDKNTEMMMQNQKTMIKMMQHNPVLMQSMMNGMMETFKSDTLMMSSMSAIIMKNKEMMNMMYKNRGENIGMMGMNNRNGMNYKTK